MATKNTLTATTLVKMASRATFGVVRGSTHIPNKKKNAIVDWKKDEE